MSKCHSLEFLNPDRLKELIIGSKFKSSFLNYYIVKFINLETLSISGVVENHIDTQIEIGETLRKLPKLKSLQLGILSTSMASFEVIG